MLYLAKIYRYIQKHLPLLKKSLNKRENIFMSYKYYIIYGVVIFSESWFTRMNWFVSFKQIAYCITKKYFKFVTTISSTIDRYSDKKGLLKTDYQSLSTYAHISSWASAFSLDILITLSVSCYVISKEKAF